MLILRLSAHMADWSNKENRGSFVKGAHHGFDACLNGKVVTTQIGQHTQARLNAGTGLRQAAIKSIQSEVILHPTWYNHTGWLGIKHQVTYLTTPPAPPPIYNHTGWLGVKQQVTYLPPTPLPWAKWEDRKLIMLTPGKKKKQKSMRNINENSLESLRAKHSITGLHRFSLTGRR